VRAWVSILAGFGLWAAVTQAETGEDLLFRGLHAEKVQGDYRAAVDLYKRALADRALGPAPQAEAHLRLALCLERLALPEDALHHLGPAIYEHKEVAESVRQGAEQARNRILARRNRPVPPTPSSESAAAAEAAAARRRKVEEALDQARRLRATGDEMGAFLRVELALLLDPGNADAAALRADLETRLSEASSFVHDALEMLRTWTEARTRVVLAEAQERFKKGADHASRNEFELAQARFREAVAAIDESEFGEESDDLATLRLQVLERWRALRRRNLGPGREDPGIDERPRRDTHRAAFLNHLQRMLDLASAGEREYRILPVAVTREPARRRPYLKPVRYQLLQDLPSAWTPALFARHFLAARVEPASWNEPGSFLEAAGSMLVARNHPKALDALEAGLAPVLRPDTAPVRTRFLLVSAPADTLSKLRLHFERPQLSTIGPSPVLYRVLGPDAGLDWFGPWLRDLGAEVKVEEDAFSVELQNGAPQTLFVTEPLTEADGYANPNLLDRGVSAAHLATCLGLLLDAYPLRDARGRTALALRLSSRFPAPPLGMAEAGARERHTSLFPRFLAQDAALFVDLPPGALLVVALLVDPFRAARGDVGADRVFLLLWENSADRVGPAGTEGVEPGEGGGGAEPEAELPLADLLWRMRDDPGPRRSAQLGFVAREPLEVLQERARYFHELFRARLGTDAVRVDAETGAVRVPHALREKSAEVAAELLAEATRAYVVRIRAAAVRTPVFERWIGKEGLAFRPFGEAAVALVAASEREPLLANLHREPADLFAPDSELSAFGALGHQARHVRSTRASSFTSYASETDLATGAARVVTEGIRITVRPIPSAQGLRAYVEVETSALESAVEELVVAREIPSHRMAVGGTRVGGEVDFGATGEERCAILARIPHPTTSTPEQLTEIVFFLTVRPAQ